MYHSSAANAVMYTADDLVLFRSAPFASWMERLTLDNPQHGIPPDQGSRPPTESLERQDELADTLHADRKDVRLVDWDAPTPDRCSATLEAMRRGVDFIVNAQLSHGALTGAANLLVRTSGSSELGNFHYTPCYTQANSVDFPEFRLCFLADMLHKIQGQLPPQLLIIRGDDDLISLATDPHIYHFRAVSERFEDAMRTFRKHVMPDPAESAQFGRWSECAREVLKQRLLRSSDIELETASGDYIEPVRKAVGALIGSAQSVAPVRDADTAPRHTTAASAVQADARPPDTPVGLTLVEQARRLKPGTYKAGPGVYRFGPPRESNAPARDDAASGDTAGRQEEIPEQIPEQRYNRRASDQVLRNLPVEGPELSITLDTSVEDFGTESEQTFAPTEPPAPNLRETWPPAGGPKE